MSDILTHHTAHFCPPYKILIQKLYINCTKQREEVRLFIFDTHFYINGLFALFVDKPGSACDGQTDERVLVRQPCCSTHCSAGQENCVTAVCHQGRQRLVWFVTLQISTGAGTGATRRTGKKQGRNCFSNCLRLPSSGHDHTVDSQSAYSGCCWCQSIVGGVCGSFAHRHLLYVGYLNQTSELLVGRAISNKTCFILLPRTFKCPKPKSCTLWCFCAMSCSKHSITVCWLTITKDTG